jgi:hypothetical protein
MSENRIGCVCVGGNDNLTGGRVGKKPHIGAGRVVIAEYYAIFQKKVNISTLRSNSNNKGFLHISVLHIVMDRDKDWTPWLSFSPGALSR